MDTMYIEDRQQPDQTKPDEVDCNRIKTKALRKGILAHNVTRRTDGVRAGYLC